jgi:hypothetical protein
VALTHAVLPSNVRSGIGGVTGDGMDMHRGVGQAPLVFPRRTDKPLPEQLPDQRALDVTTEVPGELLQWLRTAGGEGLGPVTYQLPFADERHKRIYLERQLLPAFAVSVVGSGWPAPSRPDLQGGSPEDGLRASR